MTGHNSILVTGGAGFVGSHFARAAHEAGNDVVVLDDLSGGGPAPATLPFVRGDIGDHELVTRIVREHGVTAVVHFAGKIVVSESVSNPGLYHDNNVVRTLALLEATRDVPIFVFSSSAAVYGVPDTTPIEETAAIAPISPYGCTKRDVEVALMEETTRRWCALRYFNAAGAHPDGTHRENHEPETHLIPLAIDAALLRREPLTVFGDDYSTPDGTCIRDYIHVCDLAEAHLRTVDRLRSETLGAINLGTGRGFSVREVLAATAELLGCEVPHSIGPRRPGDPPVLVASNKRAKDALGFSPQRTELKLIIEDALRSRRG